MPGRSIFLFGLMHPEPGIFSSEKIFLNNKKKIFVASVFVASYGRNEKESWGRKTNQGQVVLEHVHEVLNDGSSCRG